MSVPFEGGREGKGRRNAPENVRATMFWLYWCAVGDLNGLFSWASEDIHAINPQPCFGTSGREAAGRWTEIAVNPPPLFRPLRKQGWGLLRGYPLFEFLTNVSGSKVIEKQVCTEQWVNLKNTNKNSTMSLAAVLFTCFFYTVTGRMRVKTQLYMPNW